MGTMQGKICLITGGTNGIGKSTAQGLARLGATVLIVGRNAQKAAQVVNDIRSATGNKDVDSLLADLSSLQQIRELAAEFKSKYSRLHILVNNAGGMFQHRQLTVDGIEMTFALNHLAYFLLTNLLLDTIIASAPARIVNVSSIAHLAGVINFENLQGERAYTRLRIYGNTKLANVLFTLELARRLEGTGVTVNALHPGLINSGFVKNKFNHDFLSNAFPFVAPLIARSPDSGAETSMYLASSPEVEGITGKYFSHSKIARMNPIAADLGVARKLWDVSAEMVKLA
jgi:NAD(P)-dependent dehydrogenase (short-subunit alcohol dehydrogenase family)